MLGKKKIAWLVGGGIALALAGVGWHFHSNQPPESSVPTFDKSQRQTPEPIHAPTPKPPETKPVQKATEKSISSGTLAELTGLQADRELSKIAVELKGYQLQLKELDDKLAMPPELPLSSLALPVPPAPEKEKAAVSPSTDKLIVEAVKGSGKKLTATLRSKSGSHLVKVGDTVPGFGKVSSVSKEAVIVNGNTLPWM